MTCIVGLVYGDELFMGADSAGVSNYDITLRKDPKVFKRNGILFGYTSSFRMGQLLRYSFKIPEQKEGVSDFEYLCTDFIDSLMQCFEEKNYSRISNNEASGGVFLIGLNKKLYKVWSDFQVEEAITPYSSCGCGESYAMASLKTLDWVNLPEIDGGEMRVKVALETAEYFSTGVCGPFTIIKD